MGNPQTMVVTKNLGQYERKNKAWAERFAQALEVLARLEFEVLKVLLGDGLSLPLKGYRWVREAAVEVGLGSRVLKEVGGDVAARGGTKKTAAWGGEGTPYIIDLI